MEAWTRTAGGDAGEVRLAAGAAGRIAARHGEAAALLRDAAADVPTGVDAGEAAVVVGRVLAGLTAAGQRASEVQALVAELVPTVAGHLDEADGLVAEVLLGLRAAS